MFKKVLVANRGEIAVRIMRACRELGIRTVAIFPEEDKDCLHVAYADEAYSLGSGRAGKAYLDIPLIVEVATRSGAEAIHPGYGFLSENPYFAAICQTWGLNFIGPSAPAIERMGIKAVARERMIKAGVPVVPGSKGAVDSHEYAVDLAEEIGYPVLVKASAGGGGRGIIQAGDKDELIAAFHKAKKDAEAAFGNAEIYIEKFLEKPRHVEVQVLADKHGNIIHLGERDCSIQRRRQKLLEEAPSPAVDPELREKMTRAAIAAATAVGYTNAGTVEFLLDKDKNFYFLEMNTRIQVEHPVTEAITGVDIVKEQIRIAAGEPLRYQQEDIQLRGWAMQCRINAEDPERGFLPSPGLIGDCSFPGGLGVRIDTCAYPGYTVPPYYDSLIAKVICWGEDRKEVISRMLRALDETYFGGIKNTIDLHRAILNDPQFQSGDIDTGYLPRFMGLPAD